MAETERVERPSLVLAPDPCVARRSRDPSPAPSSLLGLGRDPGAIFRSTHSVSAMSAHHACGSDSAFRASSGLIGSRPTSRAIRTAFSTSGPLPFAISVPAASR